MKTLRNVEQIVSKWDVLKMQLKRDLYFEIA